MTLFILTETSAGYALLKAKDKKLLKRDDLATEASTAEGVSNLYVVCRYWFLPMRDFVFHLILIMSRSYRVKLKSFQKFDSAATALEEVASLVEGKVTPRLAGLLDEIKDEKKVSLAVADPKLGTILFQQDSRTITLFRNFAANLVTRR